jgi:chitinase
MLHWLLFEYWSELTLWRSEPITKKQVCGLGPDYCGDTCISTCDYKSECDPGWGSTWSNAETCPLNVCCSKYGFCGKSIQLPWSFERRTERIGTTSDFCGNKTVTKPSCSGTSTSGRTIGYYEGWSTTRACDQGTHFLTSSLCVPSKML